MSLNIMIMDNIKLLNELKLKMNLYNFLTNIHFFN